MRIGSQYRAEVANARAARRDGRIVTLANNHLVRNEGGGGVKRAGHVCVDGGGATDPDDDSIVHWGRVEAGKPPIKIGEEWFVHQAE